MVKMYALECLIIGIIFLFDASVCDNSNGQSEIQQLGQGNQNSQTEIQQYGTVNK